MTTEMAKELVPVWANTEETPPQPQQRKERESMIRIIAEMMAERIRSGFRRKYGILLIAAAIFTVYTILLSWRVSATTEQRVRQEMAIEYASKLEQYKAELAEQEQASYFLSGDASREAFLNQEIDAAARLAAKMTNDTQKGGIICNALARVMNRSYPGTIKEVADQPNQWMFYDPANKFSEHDREIAEKILRAYYEDGIIPNGLTDEYVYGSWSESDYVLRNTWDFGSSTRTWRYQG